MKQRNSNTPPTPERVTSVSIGTDYFINLEDSIRFDVKLSSTKKSPVKLFVDEVYSSLDIPNSERNERAKKEALNVILSNVELANKLNKVVAISRSKNDYHLPKIYKLKHLSYYKIINSLDALIKAGYIEQSKGFYPRWNNDEAQGKRSRIWATQKLIDSLKNYQTNISNDYFRIERVKGNTTIISYHNYYQTSNLATPIILKDKDDDKKKKLIPYKPTGKIYQMKKFLDDYNEFISSSEIVFLLGSQKTNKNELFHTIKKALEKNNNQFLYSMPLANDYTHSEGTGRGSYPLLIQNTDKVLIQNNLHCYLYRVFSNGSFTQGGRFYGAAYQLLPKDLRKEISIQGFPTVERDYSQIHLQMLYNKQEIQLEQDGYLKVINHKPLRNLIKKSVQAIINCKSVKQTIRSFDKKLKVDERQLLVENDLTVNELFKKIEEAHPDISKYFATGEGIYLQYLDSQIAEGILKHFTKRGIVCLCVHDSFIVEARYKDELYEVMRENYYKLMGFNIRIK